MKHKLTASSLKGLGPGLHADGDGLYLRVGGNSRTWTFIYIKHGKRTELGLGRLADVSLAAAREKVKAYRALLADGKDPKTEKLKAKGVPTLQEALDEYVEKYGSSRAASTVGRWKSIMKLHAAGLLKVRVDKVTTGDVAAVVGKLWPKPVANVLRVTIETLLDYARVSYGLGESMGENVARWQGNLEFLMDANRRWDRTHYAAMPYSEIGAFWKRLSVRDSNIARLLCFQILTAVRPSEARLMTWSEVDWDAKVWTIPAERMKKRREHRVPLSSVAMDILRYQAKLEGDRRKGSHKTVNDVPVNDVPVFRGIKGTNMISHFGVKQMLRSMGYEGDAEITSHGFRSSFRDWGAEVSEFDESLLERCLAHVVLGAVRAAYERTDLVEKRRVVMQAWSDYVTGVN